MKKRLFSITTAVYMLCLLTVTSCSAAEAPASGSGAGTTSAALLTAFTDIPSDAAYAQAVAWCKENGLMAGVGGSRFAPDGTLTRAMLAAVLYRAAGSPAVSGTPAFSDVEAGAWYANAAIWASEQRLIRGYGNNIFGTNDPVTKEQLTVILGRYIGENPVWTGDTALAVPATRAEVAMELYLKLNTEDNAVSNTSKPMEDWIGTQDLPGENEEASKNKINILLKHFAIFSPNLM